MNKKTKKIEKKVEQTPKTSIRNHATSRSLAHLNRWFEFAPEPY